MATLAIILAMRRRRMKDVKEKNFLKRINCRYNKDLEDIQDRYWDMARSMSNNIMAGKAK